MRQPDQIKIIEMVMNQLKYYSLHPEQIEEIYFKNGLYKLELQIKSIKKELPSTGGEIKENYDE